MRPIRILLPVLCVIGACTEQNDAADAVEPHPGPCTARSVGAVQERTDYGYDDEDRLKTETIDDDAEMTSIRRSHSYADGRRTGTVVRDGEGEVVEEIAYAYDDEGRLAATTRHLGSGESLRGVHEYDGDQRTTSTVTDAEGNIVERIAYAYDAAGRLERRTHDRAPDTCCPRPAPDGAPDETVTFTYDDAGNLLREDHAPGDGAGRVDDAEYTVSYDYACWETSP